MAQQLDNASQFPPILPGTARLFRRVRSTLGVDVGGAVLKVAEVSRDGSTPRLVDFAALPVSGGPLGADPDRTADDLGRLFDARGWSRSPVVAGLGGGVAFFRHLRLPDLPRADLLEAARWEGQGQLPYPAEDVVVDYQPLGLDPEGKAVVLMAGAPRRAVEQIMDLFRRADIELSALEVDSLAIHRALEQNGLVETEPGAWALVCDLGHEDTTLTVFRSSVPHLVRSFPFSVRALARAVAEALNTTETEAFGLLRREGIGPGAAAEASGASLAAVLVEEVQRSCEYLFYQDREATSVRVFLSGGGAAVNGLGRLVELRVNEGLQAGGAAGRVEAQVTDPVATLAVDPRLNPYRRQLGPAYACAVGLALRGEV